MLITCPSLGNLYCIFFGLCKSWQGNEGLVGPALVGWNGGAEQPNLT